MCVNNLPKVVTAEIQPRKSNALTATSLGHARNEAYEE